MVKGNDSYTRRLSRFSVNNSLWNIPLVVSFMSVMKKNKYFFVHATEQVLKFNERYELKIFRDIVKKGMTVLDIGANIGLYTMEASRAVGPSGQVFSFEPDPYSFEILSYRIEKRGLENVTIINKALSSENGFAKLYIDRVNQGNHSFSKENLYSPNGHVNVPTLTLDNFLSSLKQVKNVDVVKMDVQGAEGLIFEAANKILGQSDVKILMEFWPAGMMRLNSKPAHTLTELSKHGFKYSILDKKSKTLAHVGLNELMTIVDNWEDESDYTNLLLQKTL